MNKIIDFIREYPKDIIYSAHSFNKEKLSKTFLGIKDLILSSEVEEKNILQMQSIKKIAPGQVWLCKKQYFDAFGNIIKGEIPYLAVVVSEMERFAEERFIRIQPVTPFIQFFADDEILIGDHSITGFEFIIETWNEQPILTDVLCNFVGSIDLTGKMPKETTPYLSKNQKEFRKAEIRNTAYLRQSVNSAIEFQETYSEIPVFLNIDNMILLPETKSEEITTISLVNEPADYYLQAAKKGGQFHRPTYIFKDIAENRELNLTVIKDGDTFIISIKNTSNVEIRDLKGNVLKQSSENIYDGLGKGLYFLSIIEVGKEIRVILKQE